MGTMEQANRENPHPMLGCDLQGSLCQSSCYKLRKISRPMRKHMLNVMCDLMLTLQI